MNKRIVWIDILRIIATWGVVAIHGRPNTSADIIPYTIIGSIFVCCVPIFLMLSGSLMLNKQLSISHILTKCSTKVIAMKLFSMFFCIIIATVTANFMMVTPLNNIKNALASWGIGTNYLSVLLGCYLVTPFLYKIAENITLQRYFLFLGFIFCIVVPDICDIPYLQQLLPSPFLTLAQWLDFGEVFLPVGAIYYFMLGHYVNRISNKLKTSTIVIGFLFFLSIWIIMSLYLVKYPDAQNLISVLRYGRYYGTYVSPIIMLYSIFCFLFFKNIIGKFSFREKTSNIICHIGKNTTIIFLIHGTLISVIQPYTTSFLLSNYVFTAVIIITLYFSIGLLISFGIEHIPILNKLL